MEFTQIKPDVNLLRSLEERLTNNHLANHVKLTGTITAIKDEDGLWRFFTRAAEADMIELNCRQGNIK